MLASWAWEETRFPYARASYSRDPLQPRGGALHQPPDHLCESRPAPAILLILPGPTHTIWLFHLTLVPNEVWAAFILWIQRQCSPVKFENQRACTEDDLLYLENPKVCPAEDNAHSLCASVMVMLSWTSCTAELVSCLCDFSHFWASALFKWMQIFCCVMLIVSFF